MIRLGIADDHPAIAEAIARRAELAGDIEVAIVARSAEQARALLGSTDVDGRDPRSRPGRRPVGSRAPLGARPRDAGPPVIVVSAARTPSLVRAAMELGAARVRGEDGRCR